MAIHTVIGIASRRVTVQPSKLNDGMVTITIFGADRQHLCSVTLTPSGAAVMASALEIEAGIAEKAAFVTVPVRESASWFDINQAARGAA